jgi:histidyl-tRNA synthetase
MTLSTQPYKGARDFYPEDKRIQNYLFSTIQKVVKSYGYEEYDAPILEPLELYLAKSSQEIINDQTYAFEDRGGRKVAIRPEMTPTVSRMVAGRRQELAYPLRWYSIPNLWRYERPQRGRLREHWQMNADIFGVESIAAEHEIIELSNSVMKAFGAKPTMYEIRINSRELINYLFSDYLNLNLAQTISLVKLIDHMHKMELVKFKNAINEILTPSQYAAGVTDKLLELLGTKEIDELPKEVQEHSSVKELLRLFALLKGSKITNFTFDASLMRGFDYYTDIVFEFYDTNPENNRSMFGGGRYDGLVAMFGVDPVPTAGIGMGDVTLKNFLETHELLPKLKSDLDLYVILVGDIYEKAQTAIAELREMGLNLAVDSSGSKLDKQLKTAIKKDVRYVLFIGEEELKSGQYKLRNLKTSTEESHGLERVTSLVKDNRQK